MLKKSIKYTDFNGVEKMTIHYFNLSTTELVDMELGEAEGFSEMIQQIVDSKDNHKIMEIFKKLLLGSYGKKSDDGERFEKNETIQREFSQSAAYDALFLELITGGESALADFIKGIAPTNMPIASLAIAKNTQTEINEALAAQGLPGILPPPPPAA